MDYVKAFVVGGIICAIVQILMEKTKLMPGRIMVMLVCTGALLGAVGIYGPFSKWECTVEGCEGGSGQRGFYWLV